MLSTAPTSGLVANLPRHAVYKFSGMAMLLGHFREMRLLFQLPRPEEDVPVKREPREREKHTYTLQVRAIDIRLP